MERKKEQGKRTRGEDGRGEREGEEEREVMGGKGKEG